MFNWKPTAFINDHWKSARPAVIKNFIDGNKLVKIDDLTNAFRAPCFAWSYGYNGITGQPSPPKVSAIPQIERSLEYFNYYKQRKENFTIFYDNLDQTAPILKNMFDQLSSQVPFEHRKLDVSGSISSMNSGVGYHSDDKDVILIQMQGSRHWKVWDRDTLSKEEFRDLTSNQNLIRYPERTETAPIVDEILNPGDALFLPFAFPHCGHTSSEDGSDSLSISFCWFGLSTASFFIGCKSELPLRLQALLENEHALYQPISELTNPSSSQEQITHIISFITSILAKYDVVLSHEFVRDRVLSTFDLIKQHKRVFDVPERQSQGQKA